MGPVEPLFAAIRSGDEDGVERLLADEPAQSAARDGDGLSAVMLARYFSFARTSILERVIAARERVTPCHKSKLPRPMVLRVFVSRWPVFLIA